MSIFAIYKKGQGKYTRICTFAGVMLVVILGARSLSDKLNGYSMTKPPAVRFGLPAGVVILAAYGLFRLVNRQRSADFMIATESEMKKVSWSSRKEIVGSTKVVIVFTCILAVVLFAVDMLFIWLFGKDMLGIMG